MSDASGAEPGQVATRRLHAGRIIALDADTVRFPDGSTGEMDVVRHPGASAVLPFLSDPAGEDPQVLLIRQYRYAAGGYLWEIPAGRLDAGEDPAACAARELREETGCTAERVERLTSILTAPGFTDEVIHLFMAVGLTMGEHAREADEFLTVEPMPLSRALAMIETGEIRDGKTICALLYAAGFRAGR
ncbi:NUDIX hydrolase [Roseisolibacter sp. H3M3-2]|uniref:NUDIX hydrolase n=1 Tax=Roseisolibacter sp. H3M3-2 TaxID=3031323 RepID=UPI0023DBB962|nr:NUDIX hydrolase [Roseisolibacter sp. H3M3-2]MDF1501759.1 NUDIX hydrolase [Roseisolibacter sp. H3M3-2]